MPETSIGSIVRRGIADEAKRLEEEGLDPNEAVLVASTTMDGAGDKEGGTVTSMATCFDLEGKPILGVTGDDSVTQRKDEFSKDEEKRQAMADKGVDDAEAWLRANDPKYSQKSWGKK